MALIAALKQADPELHARGHRCGRIAASQASVAVMPLISSSEPSAKRSPIARVSAAITPR